MIWIEVRERGRWRELPGGPFPISAEALAEARRLFAAEREAAGPDPFAGVKMAGNSTAREILKRVAPDVPEFDLLALGSAVSMAHVRVVEIDR